MAKSNSFFLHCDECHHDVSFDGYLRKELIGHPCPLCGADMLTKHDYKVGKRIEWFLRFLRFVGLAKVYEEGEQIPDGFKKVRIHTHDGRTTIREL